MAVTLGKRKRREQIRDECDRSSGEEDARALFQRAFEAKFKPLEEKPVEASPIADAHEAEDDDFESDWVGLSEDEGIVQVIEHAVTNDTLDEEGRAEMKAFMSSKPPSTGKRKQQIPKQPAEPEDDAATSANIKHDLALQRLLKESHLLDPSTFSGSNAVPEGKGRLKALDSRLQGLGAKKAILEQEKMPLSHRKGIKAKAADRETTRRKEAVENGVILERFKTAPKAEKRRERGIAPPSIGKFKGGTLKLSSRDVKSLEGPKQRVGGKGRR